MRVCVTKNGESHACRIKDELQAFKMAAVQTFISNKSLLKENYTFWVGRPNFKGNKEGFASKIFLPVLQYFLNAIPFQV